MEQNMDDCRFPLELETFSIDDSDEDYHRITMSFYYPTNLNDSFMDTIKLYKDKLYTEINNYSIGNNQSVVILRIESECKKRELKKAIVEILKDDNLALLYTQNATTFIKELASFKLRHFRKEKFTFEDLFGKNPEDLFDESN